MKVNLLIGDYELKFEEVAIGPLVESGPRGHEPL